MAKRLDRASKVRLGHLRPESQEDAARNITIRIQKAVKAAHPFFDWMADQAVRQSQVNVVNNCRRLFERYKYLVDLFHSKSLEAKLRKDERRINDSMVPGGGFSRSVSSPSFQLRTEAQWLALSAIEAFFSWTEHAFIHIGS